jgi:hypothetical protein
MRLLTIFYILIFFPLTAYPTGQAGDIIIWNNKKYALFSNPLESYPQFNLIRGKLFGEESGEGGTACVRGYIAEWQIINNHLYLTNIFACHKPNLKADLNQLFPDKVQDGKIKADWINEIF